MNNPGIKDLCDVAITAAVTESIVTEGVNVESESVAYIDDLEGMLGLNLEADFTYGAGGTSVDAYVQTAFGSSGKWIDIANFHFTNATARKVINLSGLTPKTTQVTPTDSQLSTDTAVDGVLGDRLRVKYSSVGTYSNTALKITGNAR